MHLDRLARRAGMIFAAAAVALTGSVASAQDSFKIHTSAGIQSEPALTVQLQNDDGPTFEVRVPELLVQMIREAEKGRVALIPALGHVVVLPMPDFALFSRELPVISEIDKPRQRTLDLLPPGSNERNFKRVHGVSVRKVQPGTTAEQDARNGLQGLQSVCLPDMYGYQYDERSESGRGVLLTACANFNSTVARELEASIRGTVDISLSYVIDDTAFRMYSIHRSGSWNPDESGPPLGEEEVLAVIDLLEKTMIFEDIDESALKAAFLMAEN
mgnify:CR=1 FL=1